MDQRDQGGRTALHDAVVDGRFDEVRRLIAAGADVEAQDGNGMRPLHAAGMYQRSQACRDLLSAGASVDPRDLHGNTPLWHATMWCWDSGETVVSLLAAGADRLSTNEYGHTPEEMTGKIANADVAQWFQT